MTCFFVGRTFSKYGATMESNFTNQRARADKVRGINAKEAMTSSTTLSGKLHWDNQCSLIAPTKSATTYKLVYASHKEMKTEVSIKTTLRDKNTNESKEKTEKKKTTWKSSVEVEVRLSRLIHSLWADFLQAPTSASTGITDCTNRRVRHQKKGNLNVYAQIYNTDGCLCTNLLVDTEDWIYIKPSI